MKAQSTILATLDQGLVLQVDIGELSFKAYVAVSEPSIEKMAELVSEEEYVQANDWHVTAIETEEQAEQQVEDLAFNMNPGDAAGGSAQRRRQIQPGQWLAETRPYHRFVYFMHNP